MKKMKRFIAIAAAIAMLTVSGAAPAFAVDTQQGDQPVVQDSSNKAKQLTGTLTMKGEDKKVKDSSSYFAYQIVTFDAAKINGKIAFGNMKLNAQNGADYRKAIIDNIPSLKGSSPTDGQLFFALSQVADNAQEAIDIADALAAVVTKKTADYISDQGQFKSLPYGYYLVLETENKANDGTVISRPILVCVPDKDKYVRDVVAYVKTSKATINKKIVETDPNNKNEKIYVDTNTTSIDKPVSYRSLSTFPTYSKNATGINYAVTDTFSKGLTFDPKINTVKASIVDAALTEVQPLTEGTDYSLTPSQDGFTLTLINKDEKIKEWAKNRDQLQLLYSARLNKDAKTGTIGNPNSVELTYSINPGTDSNYTTSPDTVITYTYKLFITKRDTCICGPTLTGATFELRDSAGKMIETETTASDGTASFTGLDQGTYSLVETKAPTGYILPDAPIVFTLTANNKKDGSSIPDRKFELWVNGNDTVQNSVFAEWKISSKSTLFQISPFCPENVTILNFPGFVLPGTGGIGTVIFTVGGIAILLVGGCMAFLYYRKKKRSERQ